MLTRRKEMYSSRRHRRTEEGLNERQEARFVRGRSRSRNCSRRCDAPRVERILRRVAVASPSQRPCDGEEVGPNTRHKRNYYYARYSYIPFKAFWAAATAGGYYPIELVRSSPRAMSYERVLRHPLSANQRNMARQETLSSQTLRSNFASPRNKPANEREREGE